MQVIEEVGGVDSLSNTVVYFNPLQHTHDFTKHVIFFPGDIQDFAKVMLQQPSHKKFVDYSYESTLVILSQKFPNSHLWLIVPSKKANQNICVYQNFVNSDSIFGIPSHTSDYNGLRHLESIFTNALLHLNLIDDLPIILVGFSKGCVVLNQVLYELSARQLDDRKQSRYHFAKRLSLVVWLDGGHSGETETWVTSSEVISSLAQPHLCHIKLSIHVTPYQVKDEHRMWKGEQEALFTEHLQKYSVKFNRTLYFADDVPTIETHFKLLLHFNSDLCV